MESVPPISKFMTSCPIVIDADAPLRQADHLMTANRFRHLPVIRGGQLLGVVSDRDLKLARGLRGVDPDVTTVSDILRSEFYSVDPEVASDEVVDEMHARRIGSAIIVQNDKVVGIFTTTDALYVLSRILKEGRK